MNTNTASTPSVTRRLQGLAVTGLLVASVAACTSDDPDGASTDDSVATADTMAADTAPADTSTSEESTPDTAAAAPSPASGPQSVTIVDFEYDPDPVEVSVGDTITWTNEDGFAHTVTSNDDNSDFDSGNLAEGDTFEMSFDEAGEYAYICTIHTQMKATVVVS